MNKVLSSMLKGAVRNPVVFPLVVGFVAEQLAKIIKKDGISPNEATLVDAVKGVHDVSHEFLVAVGESPQ